MTLRQMLRLSSGVALALLTPVGWSLGFGPAPQTAVLGRPLDLTVPLFLDQGETLPVSCVGAQVLTGDTPVPADRVVWSLTPAGPLQAALRVRTTVAIGEPVLDVIVSAGCPPRVSRRYTLLADPPGHPIPRLPPASEGVSQASVDAGPSPAASGAAAVAAAAAPAASGVAAGAGQALAPPPRPSRAAGAGAVSGASIAAPGRPAPAARLELAPAPAPASLASAPASPPPRLPAPVDAQPAIDEAREAVIAAQEQAAAAHARADALEKTLQGLRVELRQQREQAQSLAGALERAQAASNWASWGLAAAVLLMLVTLWASVRSRAGSAATRAAWWRLRADPAQAQGALGASVEPIFLDQSPPVDVEYPQGEPARAPVPVVSTAAMSGPKAGAGAGLHARIGSPEDEPESLSERTRLMPPSTAQGSAPLQAVSMEELLELEQHVEFLVVLGQEHAAATQLMEHLRRTGGAYPLPYLKLMEIHRRIGDEQAYEALRSQFNQRFNAVAPAFGAQEQTLRGLEDYPSTMAQIEHLWDRPVDAMALLENLLFRNRGGEFFDLAALADVVFLYTLARDLERYASAGGAAVDVLLMLEDDVTKPAPTRGSVHVDDGAPRTPEALEWPALDLHAMDMPAAGLPDRSGPARIIKSGRL